MKDFMRFYKWGMGFKLHMSIYFVALLCLYCLVELLKGNKVVGIMVMLEMLLVMMGTAMAESFIFREDMEYNKSELKIRSIIWAVFMNVVFIGASVLFNWFSGLLIWHYVLLILFLEFGIAAMWFGIWIVQKQDTKKLNEGLKKYQK